MSALGLVLRDRYQFVAELGRGGMSAVYLAKDLNLDSYWAVKQVKNNSSVEFEAFKKEVELLANLNNPDIPRIVDRIEIGDDYYVVMDFIDGSSLAKLVLSNGPQPERLVVEWGKSLCDVLEYLHTVRENPIIYRDMKPDNLMLSQSGRIKLIDFGIAKEIRRGEKLQGESIGTKGYAAPEQYKGASNLLDERTDIYSLGATLFYLATGVVPQKPPKGVPALRQVAPAYSEGLEYIIAKCTADAPEERYQNIADLRADFDNIDRLTHSYRSQMSKKLTTFVACFVLSLVFAVVGFVGMQRVAADKESTYQGAYQKATALDRSGDYAAAAEYYSKAIEAKPDEHETYFLFFNAILPKGGTEDALQVTKNAIDEMRKRYLENEQSPMHHDARLSYQVVPRCIEVEDPTYAQYATEYVDIISESKEYKNGTLPARELQAYGVIASYIKQDAASQDFLAFQTALDDLENYTDTADLTPDEQLTNYYILIKMYSTYPTSLQDAYKKAYAVGGKVKEIMDSNFGNENLTFNNVIPLYELVAVGQYNSAALYADRAEKEQAYKNSVEWFSYLDEWDIDLPETLLLKKGSAYKGIFDLYNTVETQGKMSEEAKNSLHEAVKIYEQAIKMYPASFLGQVYLTQAYLEMELLKPVEERDFAKVMESYQKVTSLANQTELSQSSIMQLSTLKAQMRNAGLEV